MRKLLTKLLMTFLVTSRAMAVDQEVKDSVCYSVEQRQKIAQAITDLHKCEVDLAARNELIQKNMLTLDGLNPGPSWWQEPSFVWGGIVVGVATGGFLTFLILRDK